METVIGVSVLLAVTALNAWQTAILSGRALPKACAASLQIVGGGEHHVIDLNREVQRQLNAENPLEIVPGATHLFEEPGALEKVVGLAGDWFGDFL